MLKDNHKAFFCALFFLCAFASSAAGRPAAVSSIFPKDLVEYETLSPEVQRIIKTSLGLTKKDLAYTYGSCTPTKGGMDCSGTIHHLLKSLGYEDAPRMSHTIYLWLQNKSTLTQLEHVYTSSHPRFQLLRPGDLVFWEGTYSVQERDPPISHVMLYLGTLKKDGKGVLFGASSGRRYRGKKIHGVSVFDFKVPSKQSRARMVAFGPVPGIRAPQPQTQTTPAPNKKKTADKSGLLQGIFRQSERKPE